MQKLTPQVTNLYNALVNRKIKCEVEFNDGYKHIDITIPNAKLDIEIDGNQHYTNADVMINDIKRGVWSFTQDRYYTLHIPNFVIDQYLDQVADTIKSVAWSRYEEIKKGNKSIWGKIKKLLATLI